MFYKLKTTLRFAKLNSRIAPIAQTPAIRCSEASNVVCVSHIGHRYLYMYLLAVKSLARHIPLRRIVVVDDLTLTESDKDLLRGNIRGVEIRAITGMMNPKCPSGGDWEGFLLIGETVPNTYCILLDADTVTVADIPEVRDCIARNVSFTLGTWKNQQIETAAEACEHVKAQTSGHVQVVSERKLVELGAEFGAKYVRGCGGFAGFASGPGFRAAIERFSEAMTRIVGRDKWNEWGSQQVASNYFVANSQGAVVLPYPKYASYGPSVEASDCAFIHFIGSNRFDDDAYPRAGMRVIKALSAEATVEVQGAASGARG